MLIRYIGKFPPPFGGVTRKNQLLYEALSASIPIRHQKQPWFLPVGWYGVLDVLLALLPGQALLIGLSSASGKSRLLTKWLYYGNRRTMNRSLYFMMGGTEHLRILSNQQEKSWYQSYKKIYVESKSMETALRSEGFSNVDHYPNGRFRPQGSIFPRENISHPLRCLFFSQVSTEKGIDLVLEAAARLPTVQFDIYGVVADGYAVLFHRQCSQLPNVTYRGICTAQEDALYCILNGYDVLLLPTRWKNEGVPGVLVEAKIAGLTAIVSNQNFNSEIVRNGAEGIVLEETTASALTSAIRTLDKDRDLLYRLKQGNFVSAESYYIENYIGSILKQLYER